MSIYEHEDKDKNKKFKFLESTTIKVFPCGRRGYLNESASNYYKQLDPEARLNTEYTNRKTTGTNGFTQTFIQDCIETNTETKLALVIAGYNFEILLNEPLATICGTIATPAGDGGTPADGTTIYAFISINRAKTILSDADSNRTVYTEILQSLKDTNAIYLDFCDTDTYYFSGLGFGTEIPDNNYISLPVFKYSSGAWSTIKSSFLPKIKAGDFENSVELDYLNVNKLITQDGHPLVRAFILKPGDSISFDTTNTETNPNTVSNNTTDNKYKLVFETRETKLTASQ